MWDHDIRRNGGDSSCIDMWSTARLVQKVGCENVVIRCQSTDVNYVLARLKIWRDGTRRVATMMDAARESTAQAAEALECLQSKCDAFPDHHIDITDSQDSHRLQSPKAPRLPGSPGNPRRSPEISPGLPGTLQGLLHRSLRGLSQLPFPSPRLRSNALPATLVNQTTWV